MHSHLGLLCIAGLAVILLYKVPLLSLVIFLVLMSVIYTATPAFFCLCLNGICFLFFYFELVCIIIFEVTSNSIHLSPFLTHSASLYLFIGICRPFTINVIIKFSVCFLCFCFYFLAFLWVT